MSWRSPDYYVATKPGLFGFFGISGYFPTVFVKTEPGIFNDTLGHFSALTVATNQVFLAKHQDIFQLPSWWQDQVYLTKQGHFARPKTSSFSYSCPCGFALKPTIESRPSALHFPNIKLKIATQRDVKFQHICGLLECTLPTFILATSSLSIYCHSKYCQ